MAARAGRTPTPATAGPSPPTTAAPTAWPPGRRMPPPLAVASLPRLSAQSGGGGSSSLGLRTGGGGLSPSSDAELAAGGLPPLTAAMEEGTDEIAAASGGKTTSRRGVAAPSPARLVARPPAGAAAPMPIVLPPPTVTRLGGGGGVSGAGTGIAAPATTTRVIQPSLRAAMPARVKTPSRNLVEVESRQSTRASRMDHLQRALRRTRLALALCGLVGLASAVVAAELYVEDDFTVSSRVYIAKMVSTVSTACMVLLIAYKYVQRFQVAREAGAVHRSESFLHQSRSVALMCLELLLCSLHAPVGVSGVWYSSTDTVAALQTLDGTLSTLTLVRVYLIIPLIPDLFAFNSPFALALARWNGVRFDSLFTMRALLEMYPLQTSLAYLLLTALGLAYAVRNFERFVCVDSRLVDTEFCSPYNVHNLAHFDVALWATAITSLTVGYGDIVPYTTPGRCVSVLTGLLGIILIAILVAIVTNQTELNPKQRHALETLQRHLVRVQHRDAAARLVLESMRRNARMRRRAEAAVARGSLAPTALWRTTLTPAGAAAMTLTTNPLHTAGSPPGSPRRVHLKRALRLAASGGGDDAAFIAALRDWRQLLRQVRALESNDATGMLLGHIQEMQGKVTAVYDALDFMYTTSLTPEAAKLDALLAHFGIAPAVAPPAPARGTSVPVDSPLGGAAASSGGGSPEDPPATTLRSAMSRGKPTGGRSLSVGAVGR